MSNAPRRKIILHYHVFKNAGTSVDKMLQESLGERWMQWDKEDGGARISAAEMEQFILDHPQAVAFSSHQVVPPLPNKHVDIYPIVFIRHPLDRAYSAYLFEWKKQKGSENPGGSFADYLRESFARRRTSAIEDFQTLHFANRGYNARRPAANLTDEELLAHSKAFLRSTKAFGIVERYAESMARIKKSWGSHFPEVTFAVKRENVLQDPERSLAAKVESLRTELDPQLFDELTLRNQMDLRLYEYAAAGFDFNAFQ